MRNTLVLLLAFVLPLTTHADAWDDVLVQAGLQREKIEFNSGDIKAMGTTELQIPTHQLLHAQPLRIPFMVRTMREYALKNGEKPADLLTSTLQRVGLGVRRTLVPLATKPLALISSIEHLHKLAEQPLTSGQKNELQLKLRALSASALAALAPVLSAAVQAMEWRQKAFAKIPRPLLEQAFHERTRPPSRDGEDDLRPLSPLLRHLINDVDLKALAAGSIDLAFALQKALPELKKAQWPNQQWRWRTPLGDIVLNGAIADNNYPSKDYLLIIDANGNDVYYAGGGTSSPRNPISILIDFKGDDQYLAEAELSTNEIGTQKSRRDPGVNPRFGSGVFGFGFLIDAEGDDLYRAYRQSQARGDFGVGWLWDQAGNDQYSCWVQCQASADFGAGLLLDMDGDDRYSAFQQAQGFGGPLGAGQLIDFGDGKDVYLANNSQIDFPAQVDKKRNTSFAQGAACGRRGDFIDGYSLSGGFGGLIDGGGDNQFTADFFAQGVAYWFGVGWLSSGNGNDTFSAGKYAQAAGVHYGAGVLHDTGGNDKYAVQQELGIGHGHDFAAGFFLDEGGNDRYEAPNFSLGCASAQGMGFFWDRAGNDEYISKEKEVLGCASLRVDSPSLRFINPTVGIFLDTGGDNRFETPILNGKKSSASWVNAPLQVPSELGKQLKKRLAAAGRVTNRPQTEDPY